MTIKKCQLDSFLFKMKCHKTKINNTCIFYSVPSTYLDVKHGFEVDLDVESVLDVLCQSHLVLLRRGNGISLSYIRLHSLLPWC